MNNRAMIVPVSAAVLTVLTALTATSVSAQNRMMGSQGRNSGSETRNVVFRDANSANKLMVNGKAAGADVEPQLIGGRMMVPIRFVARELGANVTWDPKTRTVRLLQESESVTMTVGSTQAYLNGQGRALAVAPVIRDGRTLLPLRDVARFTGSMADYNPETRTVFVTTPGGRGANTASGTDAGVGTGL